MHTKQCPDCLALIRANNYSRHVSSCGGLGTAAQRDLQKKADTAAQDAAGHICAECGKVFSTIRALRGHEARSHVYRHKQAERGRVGKQVQMEMRLSGHVFPAAVWTPEMKEQQSLRMVERLSKKPFWSTREVYRGITLDSSYEVMLAKSMDEHGIVWERPSKGLRWFDGKQYRHYLPDFYLPDYQVYLDPKNDYLIVRDELKIRLASEQNNVRVVVLDKHHLTWDKVLTVL